MNKNMFMLIINKLKVYVISLTQNGFFHIFGSSVINKIVSFASVIILVRILTKEEYGVFTYAYNIYDFFALLSGFGIVSAVLQCCCEKVSDEKRTYIYNFGCRFGLIVNAVLGCLIFATALVIPLPMHGSNFLLGLMALLPIASIIAELQREYLHFELRNKEYAYSTSFSTIAMLVFSCSFSYLLRAEGLVLAKYLASIVTSIFIAVIFKAKISVKRIKLAKEDFKSVLSLGSISMLNNGLSRLMYLLDIFILGIVIPNESIIAAYKVATIIPTALSFVPSAIVTYIYPYFARKKDDKAWVVESYKKLMLWFVPINFILSILLIAFAPLIIKFTFGMQYMDAVLPFRILCLSYAVSGPFRTISGNILVTQRKLKFNLFVAVLSSAVNIVLNIIMIQEWGSVGAANATLLTVVLTSVLNTWYLVHTFHNIKE